MGICFCTSGQNTNGQFHLLHSREATNVTDRQQGYHALVASHIGCIGVAIYDERLDGGFV